MTTGTKPAKRKGAAPRQAATGRANGNGHGPADPVGPDPLPAPDAAPDAAPERYEYQPTTEPKVATQEPHQFAEAPVVQPIDHPYGDIKVYVFTPTKIKHPGDSLDPIVFPHITTLDADVEFFWELDELDPMHQAFRYMKKANVPRDIQRRVVRLPDDEMARFLNGWFLGVLLPQGVSPPGES